MVGETIKYRSFPSESHPDGSRHGIWLRSAWYLDHSTRVCPLLREPLSVRVESNAILNIEVALKAGECGNPVVRDSPVLLRVCKQQALRVLATATPQHANTGGARNRAIRPLCRLGNGLDARRDVSHVDSARRSARRANPSVRHARRTILYVITRSEGRYLMPAPRGRHLLAYRLML